MKKRKDFRSRREGGILVFVAILLPVVLILIAFSINLSWIDLCRTRTFIAADAATRAAGRTFALTGDRAQTIAKAREIAALNTVAGRGIQLEDSDFIFGQSQRSSATGRYRFTPGASPPNSMRVSIKRLNSSVNGGIDFLLPRTFEQSGFEFEKSSVSTRVDVDIAFVVDRSGSMIYASNEVATGFPPISDPNWKEGDPAPPNSRWLDLAAGANAFIQEMELSALDEFVSLVTYATDATLERETSNDYSRVNDGIRRYTNSFPTGTTNIGGGLQVGLNSLGGASARPSASKVIILMTDGKLNAPSGAAHPLDVAKSASEKGVVVFTVTFADEADQALMRNVAKVGGGQHFHASNGASLRAVLLDIVRMLPTVLTE
jgi:Ca-activated chloride channel homolog